VTDPRSEGRSQAIAAAIILMAAGLVLYFMPAIILALGSYSPYLAAGVGACLVLAFFVVFWLRARYQRQRGK
jgi:fatty acid desaturase